MKHKILKRSLPDPAAFRIQSHTINRNIECNIPEELHDLLFMNPEIVGLADTRNRDVR